MEFALHYNLDRVIEDALKQKDFQRPLKWDCGLEAGLFGLYNPPMGLTLSNLLSQIWPLALAGAVIGFFVIRGRNTAARRRISEDAARKGMDYAAPGNDSSDPATDQGLHRFSGATRGVAWTAEVLRLASEVDDGLVTRNVNSINYTRWTATQCVTDRGSLLLMNLPKGQPQAIPDSKAAGGLLAAIQAKAGALALDLYVRQRFGADRARDWSVAPSQRQDLGDQVFGQSYGVWSDQTDLLSRLTAPVRDWLIKAHASGVALLWDRHGLTLHWVAPRISPEEIAACAEEGATLVGLLSQKS